MDMAWLYSSLENVRAIGLMVLGFGFLIFVHELGHFLAARMVGVKVTQFAIGIGPAVGSWRKGLGFRKGSTEPDYHRRIVERHKASQSENEGSRNDRENVKFEKIAPSRVDQLSNELNISETEYRLNWLPLGGYVKMLGQEDLAPDAVSDDDRAFNRKPAWARAVVLSAGVVMNMIFGILFFVIAFMAGVEFSPSEIGGAHPGSPAAVTYAVGHENDPAFQGLKPGDVVTQIDGEDTLDFLDVRIASALAGPNDTLEVTIRREGVADTLIYRMKPVKDPSSGFLALGIAPGISNQIGLWDKYPAEFNTAGITKDDELVEINGKPIRRFADYQAMALASNGATLTLTFRDPASGEEKNLDVTPLPTLQQDVDAQAIHLLGLVPATRIVKTAPDSPAALAGVQADDVVARIGLVRWPTSADIAAAVQASKGAPVHLTVVRDGKQVDIEPFKRNRQGMLGIHMMPNVQDNAIAHVLPNSPFAALSLGSGSRIIDVNGHPIESFADLQRVTRDQLLAMDERSGKLVPAENRTLSVTFERGIAGRPQFTEDIAVPVEVVESLAETKWATQFGEYFEPLREPVAADTPWEATVLGVRKTGQFMVQTYFTIVRLFQGTVEVKQLRGVVGIGHEGTRIAKQGWTYLLFFLGLISINLAVMNFLPIPVLDGGQMVFLIIEKIKGSPLSIRMQNIATYMGLALILSLLVVTFFNDTMRLFGVT